VQPPGCYRWGQNCTTCPHITDGLSLHLASNFPTHQQNLAFDLYQCNGDRSKTGVSFHTSSYSDVNIPSRKNMLRTKGIHYTVVIVCFECLSSVTREACQKARVYIMCTCSRPPSSPPPSSTIYSLIRFGSSCSYVLILKSFD